MLVKKVNDTIGTDPETCTHSMSNFDYALANHFCRPFFAKPYTAEISGLLDLLVSFALTEMLKSAMMPLE